MDPNLFNVVFTGQLLEGFATEDVIKAFSSKFKIPEAKAKKILLAQQQVVLKPRAEHVKAYKLKAALESIGMQVKLQRAPMVAPVQVKTEQQPPVETTQNQQPASQQPATTDWSLQPIEKEAEEETAAPQPAHNSTNDTSQNHFKGTQSLEQVAPSTTNSDADGSVGNLIKTIAGWVAGGIAVVLLAVKKFGLFKVLKIGGLMTAAAFAGYNPEEICMGNVECEDAIDEQIDDCWEQSGMDEYDWDNMSDEQYYALKPKLESEFVSCFVYEDTGQKVLESPLEIRFDLIDNCYQTDNSNCIKLAESQLKSCYTANDIDALVSKDTMDFYQAVYDYPKTFKNYYGCYLDDSGQPLFADILEYWDDVYYGDY